MPAKYKLVLRKDMRKDAAEGSKLYYASANTTARAMCMNCAT